MIKTVKYVLISVIAITILIYGTLTFFLEYSSYIASEYSGIESIHINSKKPHQIILIDSGLESLKRRITAIENANETIDMEYFIYELDLSSQIITQKLIEAATRGVKVRILVDFSAPVFKLAPQYANFLNDNGIEVKYYNSVSLLRFITAQHRSHRKFLIIDSSTVITGGRNIGDDYFDLSKHYNFLDTDIEVSGPIVKKVQKSFLKYWSSEFASLPDTKTNDISLNFIKKSDVEKTLERINKTTFNSKLFDCHDLDFVTDSPGVMLQNRKVYSYLENRLSEAQESVIGESPYFVLKTDGLGLLASLKKRGIKQTYLTNSLYSTDAFYTISALLSTSSEMESYGVELHLFNGVGPSKSSSARWGLHAKRAVVDKKHTFIGTYNIDPRSANLNSEVLIACNDNSDFAQAVLESMTKRRANSWANDSGGFAIITKKANFEQKLKMLLALPLAKLFDFLL